jgi:glycosyltransferase involved in cell wall biosynthesis
MVVRQFYPWVGGTERQAQKLAARLTELGVDVRVFTGRWSWGMKRRETIDGIPVYRHFTGWGLFEIKGLRKFAAYIYLLSLLWHLWRRRRDYDVVHVHMLSYPAFAGVLGGRWFRKKSLIKSANSGKGSDIGRMERNALIPGQRQMLPTTLQADRMVAINREIITELTTAGVARERITVIPNGVEVEGIQAKDRYAAGDPLTLAFVGRLVTNKGFDVLLDALRKAVDESGEMRWQLLVFGDGAERANLERRCEELGLSNSVTFHGRVDSVAPFLENTDIFVLPSRTEGMSNALLEAMAHGLPCVATRIPGNVDVVTDGEDGVLVESEDAAGLAEALLALGRDEALRERLGKAARRRVEDEYSIDSVANKYIQLYRELIEDEQTLVPVGVGTTKE